MNKKFYTNRFVVAPFILAGTLIVSACVQQSPNQALLHLIEQKTLQSTLDTWNNVPKDKSQELGCAEILFRAKNQCGYDPHLIPQDLPVHKSVPKKKKPAVVPFPDHLLESDHDLG